MLFRLSCVDKSKMFQIVTTIHTFNRLRLNLQFSAAFNSIEISACAGVKVLGVFIKL